MIKSLFLAVILLSPSLVQAVDIPLPAGVEAGDKIYSLSPTAKTLEEAGWVMQAQGGSITVGDKGIAISSGQDNPYLSCLAPLEGDVLIRMKISSDPTRNQKFQIMCFDRIGVEYKAGQFALQEKFNPNPWDLAYGVVQAKKGELSTFVADPMNFTVTIAIAQQKAMVWCDNLLLFTYPVSNFEPAGKLRVRSGWKSDWTIGAVEIFKLKKLP